MTLTFVIAYIVVIIIIIINNSIYYVSFCIK